MRGARRTIVRFVLHVARQGMSLATVAAAYRRPSPAIPRRLFTPPLTFRRMPLNQRRTICPLSRLTIQLSLAAVQLLHVAVRCLPCVAALLMPKRKTKAAVPEARTASPSNPRSPHFSPKNVIDVIVEGVPTIALIDTGAAVSVIHADLCRSIRKVMTPLSGLSLRTASSQPIKPLAACTVRVVIQNNSYTIEFIVLPACSHDIILGWDFLAHNNAIINCSRAEVELSSVLFDGSCNAATKLLVAEDTDVPPSSSVIVPLCCTSVPDATVLFTPSVIFFRRKCLPLPSAVLAVRDGATTMLVTNPSATPCALLQGETLGFAEFVDARLVVDVPDDLSHVEISELSASPCSPGLLPSDAFAHCIDANLDATQRERITSLLSKFRSSFDCTQTSLGRTSTVTHSVDTGSHAPLRQRPYRVSPTERRTIEDHVTDMLQRGVIRPSKSPWASPVVLVKKKDGSIRFCVDYRRLNTITRKDVYPLPRIDDALDCLQGAEFFSSLDLRSGYWQVPMAEADRAKTAFVTPDGLYEFNVMPFGLCNAPATFERMMDSLLRGLQ